MTVEQRSTADGCGRTLTMSMNDSLDRSASALSDMYRIESKLGAERFLKEIDVTANVQCLVAGTA